MVADINQTPDLRRGVGMVMALPLLPANEMENGLNVTEEKARRNGVYTPGFRDLCERIRNYWFTNIGVEVMSVHRKVTRTNNNLESSFRVLNSYFPNAHPTVWALLGKCVNLLKLIFSTL
jgi:hypothetical protein